ncbi:hypothetical protein IV417_12055 [Alphaproteobacteria bacterium KMM 3653]|uniref:Uncharacterized protein n=1 Tax=Harenicola maris TaxID=2841044 RepID=A0AAP2G8N2_9RHOB|nr:hypothetical protein [Harenicola maris]
MTTCLECGDVDLIYVLACGDPAIGESQLLMYAGEELAALNAEIDELNAAFDALTRANQGVDPNASNEAQENLAKMLDGYVTPTRNLPEKHLVQGYSLYRNRWTRIRSDKMSNHWRRIPIPPEVRDVEEGTGQLPRQRALAAFREAKDKIASDLAKGITFRGQLAKVQVAGSISDVWDTNWTRWVDDVNDSLSYSTTSPIHDYSHGAQLLRGYAGYGATIGYNAKQRSFSMNANAEVRAVLGEAEMKLVGYFPDREGWHALITYGVNDGTDHGRQDQMDFGYFRFTGTITAHAMLGASLMGTAGVEYKRLPDGSLGTLPAPAGVKGNVSFEAFAGVEAGGSAKGGLEWDNPDKRASTGVEGWAAIFELGVSLAGNAGIGGEVTFRVEFDDRTQKFMFRCQAQLVIGLGAKGSLSGSIGFGTVFELVMYVFHQLKDNNFSFLSFISESAFRAIVAMSIFAIKHGKAALESLMTAGGNLFAAIGDFLTEIISAPGEARDFAKHIKTAPEELFYAPPEAKGAILYSLSETFVRSREEHQEAAILVVLRTVQTRLEWQKIAERVTPTGTKSSYAAGMSRLNWVMDFGNQTEFNRLIAALPDDSFIDAGTPIDRSRTYA